MTAPATKIQPDHLQRLAYIYVRQSSLAQIQEHRESTRRQYDLQQRAWQLGWPPERIVVMDADSGHSASDPHTSRGGFEQLLAEVALGRVGAIFSLEVSRLARQDSEWHRLVELAALSGALLIDEQQIIESLARLATFEDTVRVYPGHGPETTIGQERPLLEFIARKRRLPV